jgi:hypothetical protein
MKSKNPTFDSGASIGSIYVCLILLVVMLAFFSMPLLAQSAATFPGKRSQLASPDKRYVLENIEHAQEPYSDSIVLRDKTTGKSRKITDYSRSIGVIWSPDSRHFALNNHAGSDYTETTILSVDETSPKIDVQNAIEQRSNLQDAGHEYFGVARWLDAHRVLTYHWGHADEAHYEYCECYILDLNGGVKRCAHQPTGADLEGRCAKMAH